MNKPSQEAAPGVDIATVTTGVVIRSTGSWVHVKTGAGMVRARVRGRLRLAGVGRTNPVAVGDRVSLRVIKDGTGLITRVHERKNALSRRAAGRGLKRRQVLVSNVDAVWIIQSIMLPSPNPGLLDRVLAAAEAEEISAGIVLNKMDLAGRQAQEYAERLCQRYRPLGYPVLTVSALEAAGIPALRKVLSGKVNIFTGPSGVGKSALLNALEPSLQLRTGSVSVKTRKGRHTTAYAELFLLSGGGGVVDTPGIREFGVLDMEPWELSHHFPEFRCYISHCRFPACTHDHEPSCKVKEAASAGHISEERYASYLNILDSIHLGSADTGR